MTTTIVLNEIEFEVDFDYNKPEKRTHEYHGSDASVDINAVKHKGECMLAFLEDYDEEIEKMVLDSLGVDPDGD